MTFADTPFRPASKRENRVSKQGGHARLHARWKKDHIYLYRNQLKSMGSTETERAKRFSRKVCAVTAALLGIGGCLLTFQIAMRTHLAAETAEKAGQKSYSMNLHDFSDNFDKNLGGMANGIAFLCLIPIMAVVYVSIDNIPKIERESAKIVKMSMGMGGFIYTFVLSIFVTGACMDTSSLDNCGEQTVDSSNPYTNCRLQDDLRQELDSVSCPSIFFYALISSLAWMTLILSNGFDVFGGNKIRGKKVYSYSPLPSSHNDPILKEELTSKPETPELAKIEKLKREQREQEIRLKNLDEEISRKRIRRNQRGLQF